MVYVNAMHLINRKHTKQQAQLTAIAKDECRLPCRASRLPLLTVIIGCLLINSYAYADIYRFVTIDGIETFTDAPSDKKATVVIKDRPSSATRKRASTKPQKKHDISLDEIALKAVTATLNPHDAEQNHFAPHLPPVGGTITSLVGMRTDPIDGVWRQHNGIDIAIPAGTPVRPAASGVVVYSGNRPGYGNTVVVEHDHGIITLYAHNSRILVAEGQAVTAQSIVALSGSSGRSTGPHLHFEAWQAGTNVTMAFLPDGGMTLPQTALVASSQRASRFRSETLSDGSILFTNIPVSTP